MRPQIKNIPYNLQEEREITEQIREQKNRLMEEINRLVELETNLYLRRHAAGLEISGLIDPLHRRRVSGAQLILAALDQADRDNKITSGLRLLDIERCLEKAGKSMTRESISATLGRLKREGKIERRAGRWTSLKVRLSTNWKEEG
jgi:hypothetical protein